MKTKRDNLLRNNVNLLYIYLFFSGLYFDRALWVLYLAERGMNMAQVGTLEALLHLAIFIFEVPTGIIADLYGRKKSLLIGQFISLFYALFMFINGGYFAFTLAFALLGLSITFKSGAEQAFLYDSLLQEKKEKNYTKILGNQTAVILISLSIAKLFGGFMAESSWSIVYIGIFIAQIVAIVPLSFTVEPTIEKGSTKKETLPNINPISQWKNQIQNSIIMWEKEPVIRAPILLYVSIITMIVIVIFYSQEYFSILGYEKKAIGLIFMLESLLGVLAAKIAYRFEHKWQQTKIINLSYYLFIIVLIIFAYFNNLIVVISLFVLGMISEFIEPIFSNFIQLKIETKIRATVFSFISLLNSFLIMIAFPLFGLMIDSIGFDNSFMLLTVPMISIILIQKIYTNIPKE